MKKYIIATLAIVALLGFAGSSFALLCASDPVPAGTLLFPFVTGTYDASATATNPRADRNEAMTLMAVTNISSSAKIVHFELWNSFSVALLDWDAVLTGYDVYTFNFADIMDGYVRPTGGPKTTNAMWGNTGRAYSPTGWDGSRQYSISGSGGLQPPPLGPIPSFFAGIPGLPRPQEVYRTGASAATSTPTGLSSTNMFSLVDLCKNPVTSPGADSVALPESLEPRLPSYNIARIFNGLRADQTHAENGLYGPYGAIFTPPDWLMARTTSDPVWAYITADVVAGCTKASPTTGTPYFTTYAQARTTSLYANGTGGSNFWVDLGNTLIGDWMIVDPGESSAQGSNAVHIEMDNGDIINSINYPIYPGTVPGSARNLSYGMTFYRYVDGECIPENASETWPFCSADDDFAAGGAYFGQSTNLPIPPNTQDWREPLPSAFAFRWIQGGGFDGGTKLRVWKEFPDVYPYYGYELVYSAVQYSYYAWDEEENVVAVAGCPVSPCPQLGGEINQLPLEIQEVDVNVLGGLPKTYMTFGWVLLAFPGSNTWNFWDDAIFYGSNIYGDVFIPTATNYPYAFGAQAWVEVKYEASGKYSVDFPAAILGNFLCNGLAVAEDGINVDYDATDLGSGLY